MQLFTQFFAQIFGFFVPPGLDDGGELLAQLLWVHRRFGLAAMAGLRALARSLFAQDDAVVGLGEQTRPTWIVPVELAHIAGGLVG